ncbi:serine/threonine protein kinase [Stieleria sp. TO1_6]|uniref:serine/threonine-protein kinase n=1 Tax=Stieleria tagensis TaxID=2956795 RepID=UPI00209B97AC|nr:serine/threonine-protein kinase [Stieleria tagensis]MCO8122708.1 serine/threonine protein kinase [Stieleria tagensis]
MSDRTPHIDLAATTDAIDTPPPAGSVTDPDQLDRLLEQCLENYLESAPLHSPVELARFLPPADPETTRFLLVELIKLDMAAAVESEPAATPRIEDYLACFPDMLTSGQVPLDLVMEEIQLRKDAGETLKPADYDKRFPQHREIVSELLGGQLSAKPEATSSVPHRGRPPEFHVGQQVDDFVIVQTLGSGAFANVYLARQVSMSRLVALKVSKGTGDEPRALAQFDHPNIVRVFDQRVLDDPPAHLLYMQFHPGGTLADVVDRVRHTQPPQRSGGLILDAVDRSLLKTAQAVPEQSPLRDDLRRMSWPMAVAWLGIHLARALQNAHQRGVMHRDVKPANVLLSPEGVPKLADFNVSFAGSAGRAGAASNFGGSIGYMAPEHLRAISATALSQPQQVGARSDLYSLAILLWELWQGRRPFVTTGNPGSWTAAISQQLDARENINPPTYHGEDALSRLLEKILRQTLSIDPQDRIGSGAELEARLILTLHPDAARLFDPEPDSWHGWLARRSPWLVTAIITLVPNVIAAAFGFVYNYYDTLGKLFEEVDGLEETFQLLAICINSAAFSVAIGFLIYYTHQVIRAKEAADAGEPANEQDLFSTLELAHRAAVIGGILWCLAAILWPTILGVLTPEFTRREFGHFFVSHVICGGVAAIYPFFGLSAYAISIWYPTMVRSDLRDPQFDDRVTTLVRRSERYLMLACLLPLLGATLLLVSDTDAKYVMLVAIAASGLGLFAAFSAYRFIVRQCSIMRPVLSGKNDLVVPV